MTDTPEMPRLRVRIVFADGTWMGPGKAELLERIVRTGSIAAAGREMGMSYKRAWQLVDAMNTMFREPLVESTRGGARGGGATVTEAGARVLSAYRRAVEAACRAGSAPIGEMVEMLSDVPDGK